MDYVLLQGDFLSYSLMEAAVSILILQQKLYRWKDLKQGVSWMYFHYHLHWKPRFLSASDDTLKDDISRIIWSLGLLTAAHTQPNCTSAVLVPFSYLHHPHQQGTHKSLNPSQTGISKIPLLLQSRKYQKSSGVLCSMKKQSLDT